MKHANLSTSTAALALALARLTLSTGQVMAADTDQPKTRAEMMEEFERARQADETPIPITD